MLAKRVKRPCPYTAPHIEAPSRRCRDQFDNLKDQKTSLCEIVPLELRILIMKYLDIESLKNLLGFVTIYRCTFRIYTLEIVNAILGTNFQASVWYDIRAWWCVNATPRRTIIPDGHFKYDIPKACRFYEQELQLQREKQSDLRTKNALDLAMFLCTIPARVRQKLSRLQKSIDYFVTYYVSLVHLLPKSGELTGRKKPLTRNELRRLHRAIYRLEFSSNIRGAHIKLLEPDPWKITESALQNEPYASSKLWASKFLGLFDPWEVEEIACIEGFLRECYASVYRGLKNGENFPWGPLWEEQQEHGIMGGWITGGLHYFEKMYRPFLDFNGQKRIMTSQQKETMPYREFGCSKFSLEDVLFQGHIFAAHGLYGKKTRFRRGGAFRYSSDDDIFGPNKMWTWLNGNKYQDVYYQLQYEDQGCCYAYDVTHRDRRWGYVFWDEQRLESWDVIGDYLWDQHWQLSEQEQRVIRSGVAKCISPRDPRRAVHCRLPTPITWE